MMANADNPPCSESFHLTRQYRQTLSNYLSFHVRSQLRDISRDSLETHPLASWVGDAARSLALRAAVPSASHDRAREGHGASAGDWSDAICAACGALQLPLDAAREREDGLIPPSSSRARGGRPSFSPASRACLRPLKRGRTRRRRASRARARELQARRLSLQRRGGMAAHNHTDRHLREDALAQDALRRTARSHCVGDGRAKNCLVVRCAFCGTKKKRKGYELDHKNANAEGRLSGSGRKGGPAVGGAGEFHAAGPRKRHKSHRENSGSAAETHASTASAIRDNADFVSLSSASKGARVEKKSTKELRHPGGKQDPSGKRHHREDSEAFTSPLLSGKKKKKKKKSDANKGQLMEFLSSLND